MLNAVLFDLDDTLVDRTRAFRACVGDRFPDPAVREELLRLDDRGHGDREALFRAWQRHGGTALDQQTLAGLIIERIAPDHGLLRVLHALARRVKLGIVTNGGSETQRGKLRAAGLAEVFPDDRVWVSAEAGLEKPDPRLFLLASRALGEAPANCLHIGDHERDDLDGATAAGMRGRLVARVLDAGRLNSLLTQEHLA